MSKPYTSVVTFSGGGGVEMGVMATGGSVVLSVEHDPKICEVYADNFGDKHLRCADVRAVDYRSLAGADHFHGSPPCTVFSVANTNGKESELEITCANAICRAIAEIRPKLFTLENVRAYEHSESFKSILAMLYVQGYIVQYDVFNFADFGIPQTRERLIVRAVRRDVSDTIPMFLPTHCERSKLAGKTMDMFAAAPLLPWCGWYDAIADLLPRCPETKLAKWQEKRLREKAIFPQQVAGIPSSFGDAAPMTRDGEAPAPTITASIDKHPFRAVLPHPNADNPWFPAPKDLDPAYTMTGSLNNLRALIRINGEAGDIAVPPSIPCPTLTADGAGKLRALFIEGASTGERPPTTLPDDKPMVTVMAGEGGRTGRHVLYGTEPDQQELFAQRDYRVVKLQPEGDPARCIARFQTFPDSYRFNCKPGVAQTIVGNAVPPLFMAALMRSLTEVL